MQASPHFLPWLETTTRVSNLQFSLIDNFKDCHL